MTSKTDRLARKAMQKAYRHYVVCRFDEMATSLTEMENYQTSEETVGLLKEIPNLPSAFLALAFDHLNETREALLPLQRALSSEDLDPAVEEKLITIAKKLDDIETYIPLSTEIDAELPPIEGSFDEYIEAKIKSVAAQQDEALSWLMNKYCHTENGLSQDTTAPSTI